MEKNKYIIEGSDAITTLESYSKVINDAYSTGISIENIKIKNNDKMQSIYDFIEEKIEYESDDEKLIKIAILYDKKCAEPIKYLFKNKIERVVNHFLGYSQTKFNKVENISCLIRLLGGYHDVSLLYKVICKINKKVKIKKAYELIQLLDGYHCANAESQIKLLGCYQECFQMNYHRLDLATRNLLIRRMEVYYKTIGFDKEMKNIVIKLIYNVLIRESKKCIYTEITKAIYLYSQLHSHSFPMEMIYKLIYENNKESHEQNMLYNCKKSFIFLMSSYATIYVINSSATYKDRNKSIAWFLGKSLNVKDISINILGLNGVECKRHIAMNIITNNGLINWHFIVYCVVVRKFFRENQGLILKALKFYSDSELNKVKWTANLLDNYCVIYQNIEDKPRHIDNKYGFKYRTLYSDHSLESMLKLICETWNKPCDELDDILDQMKDVKRDVVKNKIQPRINRAESFSEIESYLISELEKNKIKKFALNQEHYFPKIKEFNNFNNMEIYVPQTNHDLLEMGNILGNCIGTQKQYAINAKNGKVLLLGLKFKGKLVYSLEFNHRLQLMQCQGKSGSSYPKVHLLEKFLQKTLISQ